MIQPTSTTTAYLGLAPTPASQADRPTPAGDAGFGRQLEAAGRGQTATARPGRPSLQEAADQLVSTAFVLPLLEQARQDPFKSDLFHGGRGEEVFGQQLDVIYADRITASSKFGLAEAIARQFGVAPAASAATPSAKLDTHG